MTKGVLDTEVPRAALASATEPDDDLSRSHLWAELSRIDVLLRCAVERMQSTGHAPDPYAGLVITDQQASDLAEACGDGGRDTVASETGPALDEYSEAEARVAQVLDASRDLGQPTRLARLADLFGLDRFDLDALLICLAPELDLRYERLFAYLQDDVTRKRPTVDLALRLLLEGADARLDARERFTESGPLLRHRLISVFADASQSHPPLLSRYLKADERIVRFVLGSDALDDRLRLVGQLVVPRVRIDNLVLPADLKRRLAGLVERRSGGLIIYLQGLYGAGKASLAEALCAAVGRRLLIIDGERALRREDVAFDTTVQLAIREALLQGAAVYWTGFDALLTDELRPRREALWCLLAAQPTLSFLGGEEPWVPVDGCDAAFISIALPRPDYAAREALWRRAIGQRRLAADEADLSAVAAKFRLTPGQIGDAATTAADLVHWRDPQSAHVHAEDLHTACRLQSNRKLATLARKLEPRYTWADIVLPEACLRQLREICNQIKHRGLVFDVWGFDRKISLGRGLNVLFAGPSGTGKTMAAEVMANELGLDLYKIDLSSVVSKYIGETEKNLARIFAEAETSNAILFFDEADALFGRRSEVRDSHDRYANIEISYLLQRMEEYDGMAILASNLHKNMDEAFVRRMQFTVEFPFPDVRQRATIWHKVWPAETPRDPALDLDFMARQFELTGGSIRNIAVAAAFLAAGDGGRVTMRELIDATQREHRKMGKVMVEGAYERYGG